MKVQTRTLKATPDEAAFKAGQNGLKASLKKGSTFSLYQESRIRHFHKTIDNYIAQN